LKPAIVGISGPELTADETACLRDARPLGVIMFARNIVDVEQLARLMAALRACLPDSALLMVDQEGGRVARLRPPVWRAHPPARALRTTRAAWLTGALIGLECAAAGFDVVAAPVLDVSAPDGHDVIGDRAFSDDPAVVASLGGAFAAGLLAAGIQPVAKHVPGHGRARADSHLILPVLDDVSPCDLHPFIANSALPWMMTAHIRYTTRDMTPATQSHAIIADIIRGQIGFQGVLVTDDLAMQALSGLPGERAARALDAGCDVALHCSGVLAETRGLLAAIPPATPACLARLASGRAMAWGARRELDGHALAAERAGLLG
jgi:beta-N-acetylhexosaminidase